MKYFTNDNLIRLLTLVLFCSPILSTSQDCIHSISYTIQKAVDYSISSDTDLESISSYDLLKARSYQNQIAIERCIENDMYSIVTSTYSQPREHTDPWLPSIYKSIVDRNGTRFYNENEEMIYQTKSEFLEFREYTPFEIDDWTEFGFIQPITEMNSTALADLINEGLEVTINSDGTYIVFETDLSTIFDPNEQSIERRYFEEGQLYLSFKQYSKQIPDGRYIPFFNETKTYEPLSNGGWLEKSVVELWDDYTIDGQQYGNNSNTSALTSPTDQNQTSFGQFESARLEYHKPIELYPNPSEHEVVISGLILNQKVTIRNTHGSLVYEGLSIGTKSSIDVSDLVSGVYIVEVHQKGSSSFIKFIKQ